MSGGDHKTIIKGSSSQYVKLNVGGCLFQTTIGTLISKNDTMLRAMFDGGMEVLTDSEGLFIIQMVTITHLSTVTHRCLFLSFRMDTYRPQWRTF